MNERNKKLRMNEFLKKFGLLIFQKYEEKF